MATKDGPLDGVRVADFSRILAGPYATMVLGDLGMEVIKVERPETGDDTRAWGPPWFADTSTYYEGLNRNKRSVVLDLEDEADRRLARRLAERSDVLVENFRPGKMDRWGLGYGDLADRNPGLVYCTISGFGSTGPGAELPGYDLLVQAMSGLMSITGYPDGPPTKVGVALLDMITGLYATTGILAALNARTTTQRGQHIEVSLFDAALSALLNVGSGYVFAGTPGERRGNRHPSIAPYQTYRAADGYLVLAVGSQKLWERTCHLLERDDLVNDPAFATNSDRVTNVDRLEAQLESRLRHRTVADWVRVFREAGIPAGPVNSVPDAFVVAEELGRGIISIAVSGGETYPFLPSPIRLSSEGRTPGSPAPKLGEHSDAIRAWLTHDSESVRDGSALGSSS